MKTKRNRALKTVITVLAAWGCVVTWQPQAAAQTPAGNAAAGQKIFMAKCATCHGSDGRANTPIGKAVGAKDLRQPPVQALSDSQIYTQVDKGKGNMPPFGKTLKPAEINDLVAYLRTWRKPPAGREHK